MATNTADRDKALAQAMADTATTKATFMKQENAILTKLNTQCSHNNYYGGARMNNISYACDGVCGDIAQAISGGQTFNNNFITKFLSFINKQAHNRSGYYSQFSCIKKNRQVIVTALNRIIKLTLPSDDCLLTMIKIPEFHTCFKTLVENNKQFTKFSNRFVTVAIKDELKYLTTQYDTIGIIDIIVNNLSRTTDNQINLDVLKVLSTCRNSVAANYISQYLDKSSMNTKDEKATLYNIVTNMCMTLPHSRQAIHNIINSKVINIDENIFSTVCEFCSEEDIKFILDLTRINVTKTNFHNLVLSKKYIEPAEYDKLAQNYRFSREPAYTTRYQNGAYSFTKMELLITYGYKPDLSDVEYAIRHKVEIPNISRFNIQCDQKLLELCWSNGFYPTTYDFPTLKKELLELQGMCKLEATQITAFFHKHKKLNIKPDSKAMENACEFKNNMPVLRVLQKNGGKVTLKCIEKCATKHSANTTILHLITEYTAEQTKKDTYLEEVIKELNDLKQRFNINDKPDKVTDVKDTDDTTNTDNNKFKKSKIIKIKPKSRNIKSSIKSLVDEFLDEDFDMDELNKLDDAGELDVDVDNNDESNDKNDTDDELYEDNFEESDGKNSKNDDILIKTYDNDCDTSIISITSEQTANKVPDKRRRVKVPEKYIKYFSKGKKMPDMSFINLKTCFLHHIQNNKWLNIKDNSLIVLPKDLKELLGLPVTGCIRFSDLDDLISLFY